MTFKKGNDFILQNFLQEIATGILILIFIYALFLQLIKRARTQKNHHFRKLAYNLERFNMKLSSYVPFSNNLFRIINQHPFNIINSVIFILLIIWEDSLKNFLYPQIILLWMLGVVTRLSYNCNNKTKKTEFIDVIIFIAILLLGLFLTSFVLISVVLNTIDFDIVCIAILFLFLPSFYLVLAILDLFDNILGRIFVAFTYSALLGGYTLLVFGVYDLKILDSIDKFNSYGPLGSLLKIIQYGASNIVLSNINGERIEILFQVLISIFGGYIISYIISVAFKGRVTTRIKKTKRRISSLSLQKRIRNRNRNRKTRGRR